jgi:Domain of unknown function (DUF4412)
MKKILIPSALFLVFAAAAQTGPFEGKIVYNLKFHDKTGAMSDAQSAQYLGTEQRYYIEGGRYRSEMNGLMQMTQVYPDNDTLYTTMKGMNALLYVDARILKDEVITQTITASEEKIAGYACKLLEIKSKKGSLKYWFSEEVRADPADYQNHQYGFWKLCLELTGGALPLRLVSDDPKVLMETVAQSVVREEVDDILFVLPKGLPLTPSPE